MRLSSRLRLLSLRIAMPALGVPDLPLGCALYLRRMGTTVEVILYQVGGEATAESLAEHMVAYAGLSYDADAKAYGLDYVAAKKGFGPLIYNMAMSAVPGNSIVASRIETTNVKARSVFRKFREGSPSNGYTVRIVRGRKSEHADLETKSPEEHADYNTVVKPVKLLNVSSLVKADSARHIAWVQQQVPASKQNDIFEEAADLFFHLYYWGTAKPKAA